MSIGDRNPSPPDGPVRWRAKPYRPVRRTPDMVLLGRSPWLLRASSRSLLRVPPGTSRRKRMLERAYRNGFDANANDRSHETMAFFKPEVELFVSTTSEYAPPGLERHYQGYEGFIRFFALWKQVWDEWHLELIEFFDFGDRLAITSTWVGKGAMSGIELRIPHAGIWTFEDGLCSKVELFWDHGEALQAAGLPEVAEEYRRRPPK